MQRIRRLMALAAVAAVPSLLSAQSASDKPLSFGVSGGLSLPVGDLGDGASSGYVVAGHVFFKPASLKAIRLRGDVAYDKWGVKESGGDADLRSLSLVGNAIYDLPSSSNVRPYLLGGVGLYNSKFSYDLGAVRGSSATNTDLGLQIGGGLTFKLSGFDTFAEAKFVNILADGGSNWIPISFGVRF